MRVPEQTQWANSLATIQRAAAQQARAQEQLASGRRISKASDDPSGAVLVATLRAEDSAIEAYRRVGSDAATWLTVADQTLQSATDIVRRARELTISAASDTHTPQGRESIAAEIESLRTQLVHLANTHVAGRSLFGGFATEAVTDGPGGATFAGDAGEVKRRIAEGDVVTVNVNGASTFGFGAGDDVFAVLQDIADATRAGDTSSLGGAALERLEARQDDILAAVGELGARAGQVERRATDHDVRQEQLARQSGDIEYVDLAEATIALAQAGAAYEAALAATAQVSSISLLDFLT